MQPMVLLEIEPPYGIPLSDIQLNTLLEHSISNISTRDDGKSLEWGCYPIISPNVMGAFTGWQVRRVIDNASTRALTAFGQRNTTVMNERCHVAVAGLGLLTIDEVEAQVDFCSDALQAKLNDGWRIVAVCVQPDQRRPDYVLGRSRGKSEP